MDLVIVLIFISSQLVDTVSAGCKSDGCSESRFIDKICAEQTNCTLSCNKDEHVKIFNAAFQVFKKENCHSHCGPINRNISDWNNWCNEQSTCEINHVNTQWENASTHGSQYNGPKYLLLVWKCIPSTGNYTTPDPSSFITGYEHVTGIFETTLDSELNNDPKTDTEEAYEYTTTHFSQESSNPDNTYTKSIKATISDDSLVRNGTITTYYSKSTAPTTGDASHGSQKQGGENDSSEQGSSTDITFDGGEIAGIVIGTLVCVGALALLVVLVLLRQRRLSKRLNELENPVYKDPGLMSAPVVTGSYDNEAYAQVEDLKSNGKGPADTAYDNNVTNNNPITIYDNNPQAKPAHVPYLEVVAHSNTYDEVTIQPEAPTYSVPDKDKVVPNAPPEDDPPEVPADYELAQPPVPPKSFITEDTLDYQVTGEDELVDNEAYRAFDGEGGDGLVYNDAYHALC